MAVFRQTLQLAAGLAFCFLLVQEPLAEDQKNTAVVGVTPEGMTCLIGGSMRGIIADADAMASELKHKDAYTLVRMNKTRGEVWSIGKPEPMDDGGDCESSYIQELTFSDDQLGLFQIALKGKPDEIRAKLPKNFVRLPVDDDDHKKMLRAYLIEAGLEDPKVSIKQLIAADIDGDGRQEIIVNAIHTKRGDHKRGEYSVVLMIRETAGKREVIEVSKAITLKDENTPSLLVDHTLVHQIG